MPDFWNMERRLWTDGVEAYEELMAEHCMMAFGPMGIMQRSDVIESLRQAPRWTDVTMLEQSEKIHGQATAILAYRVRAQRKDDNSYEAVCTSTYIQEDGHWRIAQHQQTLV